jgi:hypothetical protein
VRSQAAWSGQAFSQARGGGQVARVQVCGSVACVKQAVFLRSAAAAH